MARARPCGTGAESWGALGSPPGIRDRERPQPCERAIEIAAELERVEALVDGLPLRVLGGGQHIGGTEPLPRSLRATIAAHGAGADARLGDELLHRLEEVDVQAGDAVDGGQLGMGGLGREAIIADEAADDGAVLLFDMRVVVLLPGPAPGEGMAWC